MTMRLITPCLTAALVSLALHSPVFAQKPGVGSGGCFVAHFKSLVLKTHHPETRANLAEDWLKRYAASCSREQLGAIRANSPNWLGTALTLEVSSIIDATIEAKDAGNPAMLSQMYESAGQDNKSGSVVYTNPTPRAPVVPPASNYMPLAGSVNYGNMAGNTNINNNNNNNNQQAMPPAIPVPPASAPGQGPGPKPTPAPAGPLPPKTK